MTPIHAPQCSTPTPTPPDPFAWFVTVLTGWAAGHVLDLLLGGLGFGGLALTVCAVLAVLYQARPYR